MIANKTLLEDNKISAMCFSPDFKYCAVALKSNNSIVIFEVPKDAPWVIDNWQHRKTLKDQTQLICSLDWSIKNKIISCSHDRSISIWQKKGEQYIKELANLSNKLSIVCGVWAPNGDKFAIGTSCKSCYVCFYNQEEAFWSSLLLKTKDRSNFESTVTTLAFHKSSNVIAIGSADFSVKVLTCNLTNQPITSNADKKSTYQGPFASITSFGEVLLTIKNLDGWVNSLCFSPNSNDLAVFPHNNSVMVYRIQEGQQVTQQSTNWKGLPFLSAHFWTDDVLVAGGFDGKVVVFQRTNNGFQCVKTLETSLLQKMSPTEKKAGLVSNMKGLYDKQGLNKMDERLNAQREGNHHKNAVSLVRYGGVVCSYDVSGGINFWEV